MPVQQARVARRRLERAIEDGDEVVATDIALAEAYHALHYHYDVPKEEARERLSSLVTGGVVTLDPAGVAEAFPESGGAGFVDRLIHARHRLRGGLTLTFERLQGKLDGAVRLGRLGG